ncbi:kynurenine formamidase [Atheta coriaria]|uniref:kynurenine formamidase n=1 Tax=Dalotia coriaria TaxID=877792 RepID=UPI0031F38912
MSEKNNLNVQYSPSKWSTRMCSCQVLKEHFDFIKKESDKARKIIPCELDIKYGDTPEEKLDILGSDLPDDSPICFFIHGGFWSALTKQDSSYPALKLHSMGIKTFVIDYALCPQVTLKTITEQIQRAFDYTLKYAEEKKSSAVYLMGHSAGAHLVAYLLSTTTSPLTSVKSAILISGIYDLRPLINCYVNNDLHLSQKEAEDLRIKFKSNFYKKLNIFVVIAENDSPAFHEQSKQLYSSLKTSKINATFIEIEKKDHFDIMHSIIDESVNNLGIILKSIL